jgi:hypothetical protein
MRVNVDSDFFMDPRGQHLTDLLGDITPTTHGRLLGIWMFCYRNRRPNLTADELERAGYWRGIAGGLVTAMVQSGLAKLIEDGTYRVSGVEDRIRWLEGQSKRGVRSAERRLEQKLLTQIRSQPLLNHGSTTVQPLFNHFQPHYSLLLNSNSNTNTLRQISPEDKTSGLSPSSADADLSRDHKNQDAKKLVDLWNEKCGHLPKAKRLTPKRLAAVKSRLRDTPLEQWGPLIDRVMTSPWLTGQNDRGWVANFDWLMRPDTATKVEEGIYDRREKVIADRKITLIEDRLDQEIV